LAGAAYTASSRQIRLCCSRARFKLDSDPGPLATQRFRLGPHFGIRLLLEQSESMGLSRIQRNIFIWVLLWVADLSPEDPQPTLPTGPCRTLDVRANWPRPTGQDRLRLRPLSGGALDRLERTAQTGRTMHCLLHCNRYRKLPRFTTKLPSVQLCYRT
jgi:hypothetical protein